MTLSSTDLLNCLGVNWPEGPVKVRCTDRHKVPPGLTLSHLLLGPAEVPALCLTPQRQGPGPAVLYAHAHGNNYAIGKSELIEGRPAMQDPPLAVALARAGAVVICPDHPGFGARRSEGPESALAKAALWRGRSLMAVMVEDLALAHGALAAMPQVDPARIATVGFSMGATLSYLYAALRPEIAATAHIGAFADIAPLIATGAHDLHGLYMTIPGLLPDHDMGDIAALVAPRPQLVMTGAADPLTPAAAYDAAMARLRGAYRGRGLEVLRDPEAGHTETPQMRRRLFAFLGLPEPSG